MKRGVFAASREGRNAAPTTSAQRVFKQQLHDGFHLVRAAQAVEPERWPSFPTLEETMALSLHSEVQPAGGCWEVGLHSGRGGGGRRGSTHVWNSDAEYENKFEVRTGLVSQLLALFRERK